MSYVVGSFTGLNGQIVVVQLNDSSLAYNATYVSRAQRSCNGFTFPKDCDKIVIRYVVCRSYLCDSVAHEKHPSSKLGANQIQGQAYKDGDVVGVSRVRYLSCPSDLLLI